MTVVPIDRKRSDHLADTRRRIVLAHSPDFRIGSIVVRPSTREVVCGGAIEVVEPRVMQVLVALTLAEGSVVSRDDLTQSCWEGRVVGEDAIHRVISRLRRLAEACGGAFRVETVTRVGYRLLRLDRAGAQREIDIAQSRAAEALANPRPQLVDRRFALTGAGALATLVAGGGLWWWRGHRSPDAPVRPMPAPQSVAMLMAQAYDSMRQASPEGFAQAPGIFSRVVELQPDYADGWGGLALSYAFMAQERAPGGALQMALRCRAAAKRALALDASNAYAHAALAWLSPLRGNWLRIEQTLRQGLVQHPNSDVLLLSLTRVLLEVGRMREMAALIDRVAASSPLSPAVSFIRIETLWAANRIEDADRASNEAFALFPLNTAVWFTRCYFFLYTGRADQALAMLNRTDERPPGIPARSFELVIAVTKAMMSGAAADIDAAVAANIAAAHLGEIAAENAIQFCSSLGRIDNAFAVANAFFFNRGYSVGPTGAADATPKHTAYPDRQTYFMFLPSTRAMRRDARFEGLVLELGLARYWAESRSTPDYRQGGDA